MPFSLGLGGGGGDGPSLDDLLAQLGISGGAGGPPAVPGGADPTAVLQALGITNPTPMDSSTGVNAGLMAMTPGAATSPALPSLAALTQPAPAAAAPPTDAPASPQAGPAPADLSSLPAPPQWKARNPVGDVLDRLFLGGAIEGARGMQFSHEMDAYKVGLQRLQLQRQWAAQQSLPSDLRTAAILGGDKFAEEYAKNFAPVTRSAGQETSYAGPNGPVVGTATTGIEPLSGRPFWMMPNGQSLFGDSLGGDAKADASGNVYSGRTGAVLNTLPEWQHFAPGENHGWVQSGAAGGGGAGAPASPGGGAGSAPVTALPNDPYTRGVVKIESRGDPSAQNGQSTGLLQFHPATFKRFNPGGDINNPQDQLVAFKNETAHNTQQLQAANLPASAANLYLLHQQGTAGGLAILQNPDQNAVQTLTNAGFYKNSAVARRAITRNYGTADMTGAQFANVWSGKLARAMRQSGGAAAATAPAAPGSSSGALGSEDLSGGRAVTHNADGTETDAIGHTTPGPYFYGFENQQKGRDQFYQSKVYEQSESAVSAFNALNDAIAHAKGNNGVLDVSAFNNLARGESGRSATQGSVYNLMDHLGVPQEIRGKISNAVGNGPVTVEALHWVHDQLASYARTAYGAADQRRQSDEGNARANSGGRLGLNLTLTQMTPIPKVNWYGSGGSGGGAPGGAPANGPAPAAAQPSREAILAELARRKAAGQ